MKLIPLPHKVCDLTCMVNGLEDLYEWKTGERLPDRLLLQTSGLCMGFAYLKNKSAPAPRMVFWGTTAKRQYEALEDVVGFTWHVIEGRSFQFALQHAKEYIDRDTPIILGALDMYHLPYYDKFYHQFHIPIHYVLMVGYDDERKTVLVHDCGRAEVQAVSYVDLEQAWNVTVPGVSDKNTLFAFEFNDQVADVATIARQGYARRAEAMLNPPTSMFGIKGMRKLSRELPRWPEELGEGLDASLRHLAEYTGYPPTPPNRLTGYDAPDNHAAGRDTVAVLLKHLAKEYDEPAWVEAAALFEQSGQTLVQLTDAVVDTILGENDSLEPAAKLVSQAADLEEQAYRFLMVNV